MKCTFKLVGQNEWNLKDIFVEYGSGAIDILIMCSLKSSNNYCEFFFSRLALLDMLSLSPMYLCPFFIINWDILPLDFNTE